MPPSHLHRCIRGQHLSVTHRPQRAWIRRPDAWCFRRLGKTAIQLTRAPCRNPGGRERQAVDPRVVLWKRCPRRGGWQATMGPGMGIRGSGGAGRGGMGQGSPERCPHPRNAGRRLGSWVWTLGCAHCQCLLHVTPASSACPQFVTPHLEKLQRKMLSSVPLQATSSIQILPVPVETSQHDFLAEMQEGRTDRNTAVCPGPGCPKLCCQFSNLVVPICLLHSTKTKYFFSSSVS